jgi:hypothetical protein
MNQWFMWRATSPLPLRLWSLHLKIVAPRSELFLKVLKLVASGSLPEKCRLVPGLSSGPTPKRPTTSRSSIRRIKLFQLFAVLRTGWVESNVEACTPGSMDGTYRRNPRNPSFASKERRPSFCTGVRSLEDSSVVSVKKLRMVPGSFCCSGPFQYSKVRIKPQTSRQYVIKIAPPFSNGGATLSSGAPARQTVSGFCKRNRLRFSRRSWR